MKTKTKTAIAAVIAIILILGVLSTLVYGFKAGELVIFFKKLALK